MNDSQRAELDALAERLARAFPILPKDPERFLAELSPFYSPDVTFRDPIQTIKGRDEWAAMGRRFVSSMRELSFDINSWGTGAGMIFLGWTMTMKPNNPTPRLTVPGVSQFTVRDGLITSHVDHWDFLGPLVDAIPIVGTAYRATVRKLG